ncbi:MAG: hypothetical protein II816_03465 [Elusimicrobia bacterium]|nr:hypothetical protein [Elusimicrobiota bacterium]
MKGTKAFTLVELVIVIAVVIILSLIGLPIYKDYAKDAKFAEGYSFLARIRDAQIEYYNEYGNFRQNGLYWTISEYEPTLDIDGRSNKYFTRFNTNLGNRLTGSFTVAARFPAEYGGHGAATNCLILEYSQTTGSVYKFGAVN